MPFKPDTGPAEGIEMKNTRRLPAPEPIGRIVFLALASLCLGCLEGSQAQEEKRDEGFLYTLNPLIVNLIDEQGHQVLKLGLALELENEAAKEDVEDQLPRILNGLILVVSGREYEEIKTIEGKQQLRKDIMGTLDRTLGPGKVRTIYFTDFLTAAV